MQVRNEAMSVMGLLLGSGQLGDGQALNQNSGFGVVASTDWLMPAKLHGATQDETSSTLAHGVDVDTLCYA